MKRIALTNKDAFNKFAEAIRIFVEAEPSLSDLVQLCYDFHASLQETKPDEPRKEVFLSKYPSLTNITQDGLKSSVGPWKAGVEKPVAEEGTHLDKMNDKFIPPYMRSIIAQSQGQNLSTEEQKMFDDEAERIRKLDEKYQKETFSSVGGYSTLDIMPGRQKGGERPF